MATATPPPLRAFWSNLIKQAAALVNNENDIVANTANLSAHLYEQLNEVKNGKVNWVGFYLNRGGELVLGPFQGKVACIRIAFGQGVCGAAVASKETQLVPDVHKFPGHIACDSQSESEIVVPLFDTNKIYGVLDLDSAVLNGFDEHDKHGLEVLARTVIVPCFQRAS